MEHLVTVMLNGETVAYPFSILKKRPVVNDEVGGIPIVVFYEESTRSALSRSKIKSGKAIGAGAVFIRQVGGQTLSLLFSPFQIRSAALSRKNAPRESAQDQSREISPARSSSKISSLPSPCLLFEALGSVETSLGAKCHPSKGKEVARYDSL